MEEYLRQALEIVKAQAGFRSMTEEELASMIRGLSSTIQRMIPRGEQHDEGQPVVEDADKAIKDKSVTCLECGKVFRIITRKHLQSHGLSLKEYREKWGYPKNIPLVCKSLQRERRKKMKQMKLWEKRRKD